jgi:uncharacterized membrane protein
MIDSDRGQVLPLAALLVVLAVGLAVLAGELGAISGERARARTAADAAALAAAVERGDGEPVARLFASVNGAVLESYRWVDGEVTVVVRVGRARAVASARGVATVENAPAGGSTGGARGERRPTRPPT